MKRSLRCRRVMPLLVCALVFQACSSDGDTSGENGDEGSPMARSKDRVAVNLEVEDGDGSRAFVTDGSLANNCTPTKGYEPGAEGDVSERVGLFTDIAFKKDNYVTNSSYMKECMGFFKYKGEKNPSWHYYNPEEGAALCDDFYWVGGTKMVCVAFFPYNYIMSSKMVEENRHATDFELSYKTLFTQKDVVAGFTVADSDTRKDDKNKPLPEGNTVPILMKHVTSAVKFQFQRHADEMEDKLTGCWLESKSKMKTNENFALAGTLSFTYKLENGVYLKDLKWDVTPSSANNVFYKWEVTDMNHAVVIPENSSAVKASAYSGTNKIAENQIYCENDGFLMVIPQKIPQNLYLCFTTQNGGDDVVISKKLYQPDVPQMPLEWEPNKRYTYTITLSKAGIVWHVDVEEWNNMESNFSVDF